MSNVLSLESMAMNDGLCRLYSMILYDMYDVRVCAMHFVAFCIIQAINYLQPFEPTIAVYYIVCSVLHSCILNISMGFGKMLLIYWAVLQANAECLRTKYKANQWKMHICSAVYLSMA